MLCFTQHLIGPVKITFWYIIELKKLNNKILCLLFILGRSSLLYILHTARPKRTRSLFTDLSRTYARTHTQACSFTYANKHWHSFSGLLMSPLQCSLIRPLGRFVSHLACCRKQIIVGMIVCLVEERCAVRSKVKEASDYSTTAN